MMNNEKREQLQEQVCIMEEVLKRRLSDNHCEFVCWDIDMVVMMSGKEVSKHASGCIKADIYVYIDGDISVRSWLSARDGNHYHTGDAPVQAARIEMVEHLLARYKAELEAVQ